MYDREQPGIVIFGKQSIDGDNGQTGQMFAQLTGLPQATFASELKLDADSATVVREVDGGLQTIKTAVPLVLTTDLRLNTPRFASLKNIMMARKKTIDTFTAEELGIETTRHTNTLDVSPPPGRQAGIKVESVEELVDKLKNEAKVIPMSVLVVADHDNVVLKPVTRVVLAAAAEIGGDVDVLVAGSGCESVSHEAAKIGGVSKVLLADNVSYAHALAENVTALVVDLSANYEFILTAHTTTGKNFLPRVAAAVDVQMISDIIGVDSQDTFKRPIYAGNAIATVQTSDAKKVISVRGTGFDPVAPDGGNAPVESVDNAHDSGSSEFIGEELAKSERPELTSAGIVISGGRGMQSGENFSLLEGVADKLGAAIGASRAAVDAGFVPNDMQVGQTGKVVAPELYIAVGISGAIQHLAGMKDSKVIVAINKDADAPIFQVADYGLVADLFQALPDLEAALD